MKNRSFYSHSYDVAHNGHFLHFDNVRSGYSKHDFYLKTNICVTKCNTKLRNVCIVRLVFNK